MFETQSVLGKPASSRGQLAALAAFFHLTAATVLLVGLAWRIDRVEAPDFLESFLPVAFLPAEWNAPPSTPAKPPTTAPTQRLPEARQPEAVPDASPATLAASLATEPIAVPGAGAAPGSGATENTGEVGTGVGEPTDAAAVVWHQGIVPPQVLFRIDPRYPDAARLAHRQGTVVVEAEIALDGSLRSTRVVSSALGFGLEQSALDAIRSWRFTPARHGERPVAVYYRWKILFSLR